MGLILVAAIAFRLVMVAAYPALSSDMFRYVWDGRVQAAGVSPYAYPPAAPELAALRDQAIWPAINRKESVTIYPPVAELAFRLIYRAWPDSIWAFKAVMALADVATLGLLVALLRSLGLPLSWLIVYAWHPLAVYELAGNGHVEALMLPCLVLALLATRRGRDGLAGAALAAATLIKLFPILLFPALWYRRRWRMPLALAAVAVLLVWPYRESGLAVVTYYPTYLREQFNMSLAALLIAVLYLLGAADPFRVVQLALLAAVGALGLWHLVRPSAAAALRRCFDIIALLTIGSQFLQPWYALWLLPFLVVVRPADAPSPQEADPKPTATARQLSRTAWLGWLLFSGLVALSYHFYIANRYSIPLVVLEYLPLYVLLLWPVRRGRRDDQRLQNRVPEQTP